MKDRRLEESVNRHRGWRGTATPLVGWERGAVRTSNDADVSSFPPIIPYGGFSPVRLEGWCFGRSLSSGSASSSRAQHTLTTRRFAFVLRAPRHMLGVPALCRGRLRIDAPPWRLGSPPPQGSSLETGFCCPSPSSLNRPHPPHSPAHRDFAAWRLIRDAFAVRERTWRPASGSVLSLPLLLDMQSSTTAGSPSAAHTQFLRRQRRPSPSVEQLGAPK
jgi:hypothetical protein